MLTEAGAPAMLRPARTSPARFSAAVAVCTAAAWLARSLLPWR